MKFDFSEFHDLGHEWFSSYCRAQPGGVKQHLSLWWTYIAQDRIYVNTLHRFGRHVPSEIYESSGLDLVGTGRYVCHYCGEPMERR